MSPKIVVLDACVLFPFWVRDALLFTAEAGLFEIRWSAEILDEMSRNLVRRHRLEPSTALRLRSAMMNAFPNAMVSVPEQVISMMTNNSKDRHVAATAVVCGADQLVTINLRDFPAESLLPWGIEVQHPDPFLANLCQVDSQAMDRALTRWITVRSIRLSEVWEALAKPLPEFCQSVQEFSRE